MDSWIDVIAMLWLGVLQVPGVVWIVISACALFVGVVVTDYQDACAEEEERKKGKNGRNL